MAPSSEFKQIHTHICTIHIHCAFYSTPVVFCSYGRTHETYEGVAADTHADKCQDNLTGERATRSLMKAPIH